MRFSLATLATCLLLHQVYASPVPSSDDFCVYFYKKPHQVEQAGFICGSLNGPGDHVGRPNANIPVVASLTAPDWLEISLYDKKAYGGNIKTVQGNQDEINPAYNVQSFKLVHK